MPEAEELNATLASAHGAAHACLSPLGRAARFPTGIPAQAGEARGAELQATIGQLTDGRGRAIVPDSLESLARGDGSTAYLYSPVSGHPRLRELWRHRLAREGGATECSLPMVTLGLTHGLSLCADLFSDPGTDVLFPRPCWGNYRLIFGLRRQARLKGWDFYSPSGGLNTGAFRAALQGVRDKGVVLLNFPGNPTGYSPSQAEAEEILDALASHRGAPIVVIFDDAYHGFVFEDGVVRRSLFWEAAQRCSSDHVLPVKVDGCTKELLFFGGRVGFLTFGTSELASVPLVDKAMTLTRGTVNCPPGPSQVMAAEALASPFVDAQLAEVFERVRGRYQVLKESLVGLEGTGLSPLPFNSGFFALLQAPEGVDVHALRRKILFEQSAGVIALPEVRALRLAFCSISKSDIPELIARIRRAMEE